MAVGTAPESPPGAKRESARGVRFPDRAPYFLPHPRTEIWQDHAARRQTKRPALVHRPFHSLSIRNYILEVK